MFDFKINGPRISVGKLKLSSFNELDVISIT